jgi:predicted dienelactone hydrolase
VLVYSHGYKGFAGGSHNIMRLVASHGWLAAAPEHVGNTLADTPDQLPLQVSLERAFDVRAALDWLAKPPAAEPLAGNVDLDHVGLSGHSFGTWTTWAVAGATISEKALQEGCAKGKWPDCSAALLAEMRKPLGDPRVKTILALAGDGSPLVHDHGIDAVKIPVLQMNGGLDNAGQAELYAAATAVDLTWVKVAGGCHQLYGLGNTVIGNKDCAVLPDAEGFAVVRPWILAWLRYTVLGDKEPLVVQLVTGKVLNSPLVTFQHKGP